MASDKTSAARRAAALDQARARRLASLKRGFARSRAAGKPVPGWGALSSPKFVGVGEAARRAKYVAERRRRKATNPKRRRQLTNQERFLTGRTSPEARRLRLARRHVALIKAADRRLHRKRHSPKTAAAHSWRQRAADRVARLWAGLSAPKRRRKRRTTNPRKGKTTMARLARNRKGQFLPRGAKRRRRRSSGRTTPRRRRRVTRARRPAVVLVNPRRRRRRSHSRALVRYAPRRHRRRARNPALGGSLMRTAKAAIMPMGLGALAGGVAGYADAKFLGSRPTVSILVKLGLGVAGAAFLGRRHPTWAMGWAGGMMGSTGYYAGVKMAGGLVALSPQAALKGIADMAAEDPEMAAQIAGLADVVDDSLGDAADDYNDALGDDGDDMGDVVDVE